MIPESVSTNHETGAGTNKLRHTAACLIDIDNEQRFLGNKILLPGVDWCARVFHQCFQGFLLRGPAYVGIMPWLARLWLNLNPAYPRPLYYVRISMNTY